ncbi:MAG: DNA primase [Alphaproteobacteria bacterium]|nr:DNA primase [Alphaproteobacteria bacterium]
MAFPPSFLEELRSRLTLSSVVGRRVKLARAGREYKACCPFHNEKSPSFYVNDDKNFFHCFGCGAHGDVIGFTMKIDNLGFLEAVEKLAGEAGLEVPRLSPQARQEAERAKTLAGAVEAACVWFQTKLRQPEGRAALGYLHGRGLTDETIERFRLGFAPEGRSHLQAALKAQGFETKLLLEAGLIGQPDDGRDPFDFFRNRVIFPITDRRGRVIAFGGRVMDDSKPKYLNSRDTPLFHKRENLYALDKARVAVGERKAQAIVAEGYMDVIALHQAGFAGAVAPLGTALTEGQIQALWKIHSEPVVCLDGDAAGQRAALKAADVALPLLKPGYALRFATLPAGEDPDSLVKRDGPGAMQGVLSQSRSLADIVWSSETDGRAFDSPDRRAALEGRLREHIQRIVDPTVRRAYESEWVFTRLRALGRPVFVPRARTGTGRPWTPKAGTGPVMGTFRSAGDVGLLRVRQEQVLLATAIGHPNLLMAESEALAHADLTDRRLELVRQALVDCAHAAAADETPLDMRGLIAHLSRVGLAEEADLLTKPTLYEHGAFADPTASDEAARVGFGHLLTLLSRRRMEDELRESQQALAREASAENLARVEGQAAHLRAQVAELAPEDEG